MYIQVKTDLEVKLSNGEIASAVATLKDEYGGVCQILIDDHCYVLYLLNTDGMFIPITHIFQEAFDVLKTLPDLV